MTIAALQATSPAVTVESIAMGVAALMLTAFWKDSRNEWKKAAEWRGEMKATLFGVNGTNGLVGTSKDHETRIRELEQGDR